MTDDLTTRLLAAIEDEPLRDTHDSDCLLFGHPADAWCDRDCRERTKRHCAAHRKIVELHVSTEHTEPSLAEPFQCDICLLAWKGEAREPYPCPTLRALAEAYDLTTEPAP